MADLNTNAKPTPVAKPNAEAIPTNVVPTGVKVIAVLYYIVAGLSVLGAIAFFFGAGFLADLIPILALFGGILIVVGIVILLFAVLDFFIGRGLWKAQKWARIVAIIFSILGIIGAIISLIQKDFTNIVTLIVHGLIAYYLIFNASVKQAFA